MTDNDPTVPAPNPFRRRGALALLTRETLASPGGLRQLTADVQEVVAHLMKGVEGHPSQGTLR